MNNCPILNKQGEQSNLWDLLAEARAIHFAMRRGAISYEIAKIKAVPILQIINKRSEEIAKKHGVRARKIIFQDLGRLL